MTDEEISKADFYILVIEKARVEYLLIYLQGAIEDTQRVEAKADIEIYEAYLEKIAKGLSDDIGFLVME